MYDTDISNNRWMSILPSKGRRLMRLFCLPFAGGGTAIYYPWKDRIPEDIELVRIQLPGRETRLREKAYSRMENLIENLREEMLPWLDRPFAFFGHSMGALIAFELARSLRMRYGVVPSHLFVSGYRAPQISRPAGITGLPDAEFIARLRQYGGIPEQIVQSPELLEIFLPILRSDFEVLDTYAYQALEPLNCPITAFGGETDPKMAHDEIAAWQIQTSREFECHFLPGGHFFINESQSELLEYLSRSLREALVAYPTSQWHPN